MSEAIQVVLRGDESELRYRARLDEHTVLIDKWVGSMRSGEWTRAGQGLWSGKHVVFCDAKLASYDYLVIEDEFRSAEKNTEK